MIYVISKSTFGSYNVRDIQCNANWDCCPYSDYALIPDNLVEGILATKGYCDITLDSAGTTVASFTARTIPAVPRECCSEVSTSTTPKTAIGSYIAEDDSIRAPLLGLKLYGKTTQDGTPTPDAPVDLVTAGASGSIVSTITDGTDSNVQTLTAQTPNGLPGIPCGSTVLSNIDYTDENGQKWCCDTIDFARGVYVQRIVSKVLDGTESWTSSGGSIPYFSTKIGSYNYAVPSSVLSTHFARKTISSSSPDIGISVVSSSARNQSQISVRISEGGTASGVKAWFAENPTTVLYALTEPIETPLSAEELAQYAALHTNKPETTVYNDAVVDMEVSYFVSNAAVLVEAGSANEGKFLRVVNGVATWATVNTAEGASF